MTYRLKREVVDGVENVSLAIPEADAYLKFVRDRCRLNTLLSYGYDLQVYLNSIQEIGVLIMFIGNDVNLVKLDRIRPPISYSLVQS